MKKYKFKNIALIKDGFATTRSFNWSYSLYTIYFNYNKKDYITLRFKSTCDNMRSDVTEYCKLNKLPLFIHSSFGQYSMRQTKDLIKLDSLENVFKHLTTDLI
jgi:hypothetical protein